MKRIMLLIVTMLVALVLAVAASASPLKMAPPDGNLTWLEQPVTIGSTATVPVPEVTAHNLIVPRHEVLVADVHVNAYTKRDGTHVREHTRSDPDGIEWNNKSYRY